MNMYAKAFLASHELTKKSEKTKTQGAPGQFIHEGENGKPQIRHFSGLNRHERRRLEKLNRKNKCPGKP